MKQQILIISLLVVLLFVIGHPYVIAIEKSTNQAQVISQAYPSPNKITPQEMFKQLQVQNTLETSIGDTTTLSSVNSQITQNLQITLAIEKGRGFSPIQELSSVQTEVTQQLQVYNSLVTGPGDTITTQ